MTEARPAFTYATVPLRRDHLRQPAMLDPWNMGKEKSYPLPLVAPGGEARVIDADYHWQRDNGRRGVVTHYSYFTRLHTLALEGTQHTYEVPFLSREIMKVR